MDQDANPSDPALEKDLPEQDIKISRGRRLVLAAILITLVLIVVVVVVVAMGSGEEEGPREVGSGGGDGVETSLSAQENDGVG